MIEVERRDNLNQLYEPSEGSGKEFVQPELPFEELNTINSDYLSYNDIDYSQRELKGLRKNLGPINYFRNEHWFLSSMYPLPNGVETRDGIVVGSVEIGYQADKYEHREDLRSRILQAEDGFQAKKIARIIEKGEDIPVRGDWEEKKYSIMKWYVWQKFGRNKAEADMLLATGNRQIAEGNNRGDDYWGVIVSPEVLRHGKNELGRLLMLARSLLRDNVDLIEDAKKIKTEEQL